MSCASPLPRFRRRLWSRWLLCLVSLLPSLAFAADRAQERQAFRRALDAIERDRDWKAEAAVLVDYPLLPALQARELAKHLDTLKREDLQAFIARAPDALATVDLR